MNQFDIPTHNVSIKECYKRMIGKYNVPLIHNAITEHGLEMDIDDLRKILPIIIEVYTRDLKKLTDNMAANPKFATKVSFEFKKFIEDDMYYQQRKELELKLEKELANESENKSQTEN